MQGDDDEAFNKYIEYDDSDSDWDELGKENTDSNKPQKSTQEQIHKVIAFTNDYSEESVGKSLYSALWDSLTTELNNIGPPSHPKKKWKRICTVNKYNKKIRSGVLSGTKSSSSRVEESLIQVKPSIRMQPPIQVPKKKARIPEASVDIDVHSRSAILEKLSIVLSNQNAIVQKVDESKSLLEEITQSLVQ